MTAGRRTCRRLVAVLTVLLAGSAVAGCGPGGSGENPPAAIRFTAVDLPAGSVPVALAAAGDALLVGVRRDGQPVVPGLLRLGPDASVTELPVEAASPYGRLATWQSIATDGQRIVAVGGERGGAHGHVRWSVWNGSTAGLGEQVQGFSTFGGYAAGDLIGAVLTPEGPMVVGAWESARTGFDVAVWTNDGDVWTRQSSADTALESNDRTLGFPMAATGLQRGVLVAGWQLALDGGRQLPAVWQSSSGNTGWTSAQLPDAGQLGAALAVACWGAECGVAGRVDGKLAVWRLSGGSWVRVAGAPPVAVGDKDKLAPPVEVDGQLVQAVSDGGQIKVARSGGDGWTVRDASGPTGRVTATVRLGDTVYLVAGPDDGSQALWRADVAALR